MATDNTKTQFNVGKIKSTKNCKIWWFWIFWKLENFVFVCFLWFSFFCWFWIIFPRKTEKRKMTKVKKQNSRAAKKFRILKNFILGWFWIFVFPTFVSNAILAGLATHSSGQSSLPSFRSNINRGVLKAYSRKSESYVFYIKNGHQTFSVSIVSKAVLQRRDRCQATSPLSTQGSLSFSAGEELLICACFSKCAPPCHSFASGFVQNTIVFSFCFDRLPLTIRKIWMIWSSAWRIIFFKYNPSRRACSTLGGVTWKRLPMWKSGMLATRLQATSTRNF